jgi:hypothetical protein
MPTYTRNGEPPATTRQVVDLSRYRQAATRRPVAAAARPTRPTDAERQASQRRQLKWAALAALAAFLFFRKG